MKYEFDSWEEVHEAMKDLSKYHDCEKCRGKIVFISIDKFGNSICGYCSQIVKYPTLSKRGFEIEREKWLKENVKGKEEKGKTENFDST